MTITFTYKDIKYTLEYTKETVAALEDRGYVAEEIGNKPMSNLVPLYECAFLAHHPMVTRTVTDEIYKLIPNKADVLRKLAEMANEQYKFLSDEPEENAEGNLVWMVS